MNCIINIVEQQQSKIISCVYGDYIPKELKFRSHVFFNKPNPFRDPMKKLRDSLSYKKNLQLINR